MGGTMGWIFARATFIPTLVFNVAMEKISSRRWFNHIDDKIILGALPFKNMTDELVSSEGVRGVISMNEDYELRWLSNMTKEWAAAGVQFLQLNTTDMFEVPSLEKLERGVKFIHNIDDGKVYVHCKAGRTRSATLVACYLMDRYKLSPEESVERIRQRRPHIYLGSSQLEAIQKFHSNLTQDS